MKRLKWVALLVVLLLITSAAVISAGKVTTDPNAPGIQRPATSSDEVDKRLAQKITYDSGYKRLHTVADDIAKLSGVSVACGKNSTDWRVRDIPLVVCVRDMPLGKLLRAVADATHTRVASERVGNDPIRHYRIYRRMKEEQAIANLLSDRHATQLAQLNWQWDALVAYGKSGKEIPGVRKDVLPLAKIIATLGPDAKDRMLSGDTFYFRGSNAAYSSTIADFQRAVWDDRTKGIGGEQYKDVPAPTAKDTAASVLALKIVDEGETGDTQAIWSLAPSPALGTPGSSSNASLACAYLLDSKGLNLPPYPKDPPSAEPKQEMDNKDMVFMAKRNPDDWNYPPLQAKIDIAKPEDLKNATFADALRALAKASGCNIVAEDFLSHMDYYYQNADSVFSKDTAVADRLRNLETRNYWVRYNWFFGKDNNLLIGWASDIYPWMDHHRNLLSERYLNDLKRKLDGPGVQLDDVVGFWNMTVGSYMEWIVRSRDLNRLERARPSLNLGVYRLYDSLTAADKALAKSESGLPIAKLNSGVTSEFFRSSRMMQWPYAGEDKPQGDTKTLLDDRAMTDRKVIDTMTMRVVSTPVKTRSVRIKPGFGTDTFGGEDVPPALKLSIYMIRMEYTLDGKKQTVDCPCCTPLPLYSPEREAEIIKAAENKASK